MNVEQSPSTKGPGFCCGSKHLNSPRSTVQSVEEVKDESVADKRHPSEEKGYVLPTVYHGNYGAVCRKPVRQAPLLSLTRSTMEYSFSWHGFQLDHSHVTTGTRASASLRRLGICFISYSPISGGFLTKTTEEIKKFAGRFDKDHIMSDLYNVGACSYSTSSRPHSRVNHTDFGTH